MTAKGPEKRLEEITLSTDSVTQESTNEFFQLIQKHYPRGAWKNNPSVQASVQSLEMYLKLNNEGWAKEKLGMLEDFKTMR